MSAISNRPLVNNNYFDPASGAIPAGSGRVGTPRSNNNVGSSAINAVKIPQNDYQVDIMEKAPSKYGSTHTPTGVTTQAGVTMAVTKPTIVSDATDLIPMMENGDFKLALPMIGGTKIGPMKVRDDSRGAITFAVEDGKIDYSKTRIFFEREDGSETDLDGPLFFDARSIYIDEEGHIIADVKCFPDINITELVLDGEKKVPDTMEGIAKLMAKLAGPTTGILAGGGNLDVNIKPDLPQIDVNGNEISVTIAPAEEEPEPERVEFSYNDSTDPLEAQKFSLKETMDNPAAVLLKTFDLNKTEVSFSGTMKSGPLVLGKELSLNIEPGSKVEVKGTPAHLQASMELPVKNFNMQANGTMVHGGSGNISLGIDFSRATDRDDAFNLNTPMEMQVAVKSLNLDDFKAEIPAPSGSSNSLEFGKLDLAADGEPLIKLGNKEGIATLDVTLPKASLDNFGAQLEITGSDGQPAQLKIGNKTDEGRNMQFSAGVEFHSADGVIKLDAEVQNLAASLNRLAVVDSDCFDLTLGGAALSGSGRLVVDSNKDRSIFQLDAAENQPFTISANIEDALLGDMNKGGLLVDMADGSSASVAISQLSMGGSDKPVFRAAASIDVQLDALNLPMGENNLNLAAGSRGTLTISDMGWKEGAASPDFQGELRLALGRDSTNLTAGPLEGMDGASIEIDSSNGEASLVLKASLDEDGNIQCAGGLTFDKTLFKAAAKKGHVNVQEASLNGTKARLDKVSLNKVRNLQRKPEVRQQAPIDVDEVLADAIPPININMQQLVGSLSQTSVNITIPVDRLSGELMKISEKEDTTHLGFLKDTTGYEVTVRGYREAGPITATLSIDNGKLQKSDRAINFNPPLSLLVKGEYWLPVVPGSPDIEIGIVIKGMEIRIDEKTGKGYFYPVFDFAAPETKVTKFIYDGVRNKLSTFLSGLMGNALFGSKKFDLNFREMYKNLDQNILSQGSEPSEPSEPSEFTKQAMEQIPGLLQKVHLDKTLFNISKTQLKAGVIDLGNGQKLTIGDDSNLHISGSPDNFLISGSATLGETVLGGGKIGAKLNGACVDLNLKVTGAASGNPQISLIIDDIHADTLSVNGEVNDTVLHLNDASVNGGKLRFVQRGEEAPSMDFEFPDIVADISLQGGAMLGETTASADAFIGKINGSLSMKDGDITGKIDKMDITAIGLNFGSGDSVTNMDLCLSGAGKIKVDHSGHINFTKLPGKDLDLDIRAILSDGSLYEIGGGTVNQVSIDETGTSLGGIQASVNCIAKLPVGDNENMMLDIRGGFLSGGIKIGETFSTIGDIKIEDIDASITNFTMDNETLGLDLKQFDLNGSGSFNMSSDGVITVKSAKDNALSMSAVADDIKFNLPEQNLALDLAEGVSLRGNLDYLQVGGPNGPALKASNGYFFGAVENGTAGLPMGNGNIKAQIKNGSKISTSFNIDYGLTKEPKLEAKVNLEGAFDLSGTNMAAISAEQAAFNLTKLDSDGKFQMQLNAKTDGKGGFAASTALELSGHVNLQGSGKSKL